MSEDRIGEYEAVAALASMYEQYCGGRFGHDHMNAGEDACEVLRQHGLIKDHDELDDVAVFEFEKQLTELVSIVRERQ